MMKKDRNLMGVFTAIAAICICFWLVPDTSYSQQQAKPSVSKSGSKLKRAPLKQKGSVEKVYADSRRVIIDGVMYFISEKLVVKSKKGDVLPDYRIKYLAWANQIEFTSSDYLISEIVILKNAS